MEIFFVCKFECLFMSFFCAFNCMSEDLEYINSKCYVSYLHKCTKYRLCGYPNNVYLFILLSLFLFLAKCFLRLTPLQSPVSDPFKDFCCSTCCPPLHFSCMELGDKARTALVSYDLHISQAVLA